MFSVMHNSQKLLYKTPFGAGRVGSNVSIAIEFSNQKPQEVFLRTWDDKEQLFHMNLVKESHNKFVYSIEITLPDNPCNLWYFFIIKTEDKFIFYGNNPEQLGGEGQIYTVEPPAYQITVYQESQMPQWLYGGMIYQIFPDRFFNPYDKPLALKKDSLLHDSWYSKPLYARDCATNEIIAYDFYGGNLDGITAKLDYLEDFGVNLIYLNPVFLSVSNHRFDTADYEQIDPMLGDVTALERLCQEAKKRNINVILDGVFSHTGSDSRYFNKEGTYKDIGACQSKDSPYYNWYTFTKYPDEYESWWGIGNVPNVNELNPSYINYIIESKKSIVARWLQVGVKGWRLDVADELPEEFIKRLRLRIKMQDKESVLLGEVWEDASHKNAYGNVRNYFLGDQLDSVMNYPFRQCVLDFLLNKRSATSVLKELYSLYENYPRENFDLLMNLLGTHDTERLITQLAQIDSSKFTDVQKRKYQLNDNQQYTTFKRLWLALVWQMTFAGLPSIYYGDEAGMQGFADPFNRGAYPWQQEDQTVYRYYWRLSRLRQRYDVFKYGTWEPLNVSDDILAYNRTYKEQVAIVAINRSDNKQSALVECSLPMVDLLTGKNYLPDNGYINIELNDNAAAILHNKIKYPDKLRKAGILLHPTSLFSDYGIGDLGQASYDFIDFLHKSGHQIWQTLPINSTDNFGSPYAGESAFAGNVLLISPEILFQEGYISKKDLNQAKISKIQSINIDFAKVREIKDRLFAIAFTKFDVQKPDFELFCQQNKEWLDSYALFQALKKHFNNKPWQKWSKKIAAFEQKEVQKYAALLKDDINYHKFLQYEFWRQWEILRTRAKEKNITLIGDVPIYISSDSVDVWSNQQLFQLDTNGLPQSVAGVPPDYFSKTGQKWGNPLYNWQKCKEQDYLWWKNRLSHALKSFDLLRLDHFLGFENYWSIPADKEDASFGSWVQGPGADFFLSLKKHFGKLPFIAEDLGEITPGVNKLRDRFCLPGMDILQFGLSLDTTKILYTGTHDNDTLVGWVQKQQSDEYLLRFISKDNIKKELSDQQKADLLLEFVYKSDYSWIIVPIQDLLGLNSTARMNTPSTVEKNWSWKMTKQQLSNQLLQKAVKLVNISKRQSIQNIDEIIF